MDDTVLPKLVPFLREIVVKEVPDVRKLLTQEYKDSVLYKCLEENQEIPALTNDDYL